MTSNVKPQLVIIEGKDKGKVIPLRHGTVIIGRSKGDVIVQDPRVSRSHVAIHFDEKNERITCRDLKSLNGTLVNSVSANEVELSDGDQLQVGDTIFDVQFAASGMDLDALQDSEPIEMKNPGKPKINALPKSEVTDDIVVTPVADNKTVPKASKKKKAKPKRRSLLSRLSTRAKVAAILLICLLGVYPYIDEIPFGLPGGVDLNVEIARVTQLSESGKNDLAIAEAFKLSGEYPEEMRVHVLLGDLYSLNGKNESAIGAYRKALTFEDAPKMLRLRLVTVYLRANMGAEAKQELIEIDKLIKETVRKFVGLIKEKNTTPEVVLEQNPEIRELLVATARIFVEFHKTLNAGWDEEKTLILTRGLQTKIAPEDPVGYLLEAQILLSRKRIADSAKFLSEARKRLGSDRWAMEQLARMQFQIGDYDAASVTAQSWGQLDPESMGLKFLLQKLDIQAAIRESDVLQDGLAIKGKMNQVVEMISEAEKYDTGDEWLLEQKALARLKLVDLEGAAATADKWLKLYPDSPKALIVMSYIRFYERRAEEATPLIQKVITLAQKSGDTQYLPDAVYLYGRILAQQDKVDEAKQYIKHSCSLGSKEACADQLIAGEPTTGSATSQSGTKSPSTNGIGTLGSKESASPSNAQ